MFLIKKNYIVCTQKQNCDFVNYCSYTNLNCFRTKFKFNDIFPLPIAQTKHSPIVLITSLNTKSFKNISQVKHKFRHLVSFHLVI